MGFAGTFPGVATARLIVIRPGAGAPWNSLREVWEYRELLYFLTWRDVKIRYRQTVLGVAWALIQPLLMMIVFTFLFGRLVRVPTEGIPYSLFALAGLLPWTFFATAVTSSGNSLVGSAHLISKVYFPRVLIPASAVLAALVDLLIGGGLLFALMFQSGVALGWSLLAVPGVVALTSLLALATGIWLSALNAKYRDLRHALPFLMQLWLFATPVIYPSSLFPERWRWLLKLNPMTGLVEAFRALLFGMPLDWGALGLSALFTLLVLLLALVVFRRMEREFADII